MEKPIRILENERIHGFNDKVRGGIEHALNFMMGEEGKIQVGTFEPFLMPIEAYLTAYKKKSVMIRIRSDRDYKGEIFWFFEMDTAINLGSMLRMMPPISIEEKLRKGEFDAADQDAFGEVGNQLSGILDRAFRTLTRKDIHLKMDFEKKVYPNEKIQLSTFQTAEEYVVLLSNITITGRPTQKITLLLPRSLYEVMLNLEVSLEGITPKKVLMYSCHEATRESVQTNLNSRRTKVVSVDSADEILTAIEQEGIAAVGIQLERLSFPLQHKDNIFLKRLASNRGLQRIPYFLTWEDATAEEVKQLAAMGLVGATDGSFSRDFPAWAKILAG